MLDEHGTCHRAQPLSQVHEGRKVLVDAVEIPDEALAAGDEGREDRERRHGEQGGVGEQVAAAQQAGPAPRMRSDCGLLHAGLSENGWDVPALYRSDGGRSD